MPQPAPPETGLPDLDSALLDVLRWLWQHSVADHPALQQRARQLLLDTIGCAIAGLQDPLVQALFHHGAQTDPGAVAFPGSTARLSTAATTTCIAAAACWHEACEGLPAAHGRPGLHAIPAILGPALLQAAPLGTALDAITAGYEIGGRLGSVLRIRPGMHVDGTWGSFAAATAACRLARDTPEMALAALNHTACHMPFSLYRPIPFGSTARNAYAGHGATHGATAAWASRAGLGGPPGSIAELASLALGITGPALLDFAPPGQWLLPDGYLKPFPAVRHVHYGAIAGQLWHQRPGATAGPITAVKLRIYQEALTYCGNRAPQTPIQAQFSLTHGLAATLLHGRLDPQSYTPATLADPALRHLEHLIELEPDPSMTEGRRGCTLTVEAAGTIWTHTVDTIPGDPSMPLSQPAILAKFMSYATPVLGQAHANAIAHTLLDGALTQPFQLDP